MEYRRGKPAGQGIRTTGNGRQAREGRCHPAPDQTRPQPLAAAGQAALDRPHRPAEPGRGLLVGQLLQVAEHDRLTVRVRQPIQLLVDDGAKLRGLDRIPLFGEPLRHGETVLMPPPPGRRRSRTAGDAVGHPVKPACGRVPAADGPGTLGEHQEGGLESILGVVRVDQDLAANTPDHRPVPPHQLREGGLGGFAQPRRKPLQELTIGQVAQDPSLEQMLDPAEDRRSSVRHACQGLISPNRLSVPRG